jgi:hypothetical protein
MVLIGKCNIEIVGLIGNFHIEIVGLIANTVYIVWV